MAMKNSPDMYTLSPRAMRDLPDMYARSLIPHGHVTTIMYHFVPIVQAPVV